MAMVEVDASPEVVKALLAMPYDAETCSKEAHFQSDNPEICKHHWAMEIAHGPISLGACRHCPAVREFRNSSADIGFGEQFKVKNSIRPELHLSKADLVGFSIETGPDE